jgi:hypothetical protein
VNSILRPPGQSSIISCTGKDRRGLAADVLRPPRATGTDIRAITKESLSMTAVHIAVVGAAIYFFVFGTGFVFRPALIAHLGLQWINPAGQTEVRCYYGAVSWALGAFLLYLLNAGLAVAALTGVLFLAAGVLLTRIVGTILDGAQREGYTRMAIPIEIGFVVILALIRLKA